MNNLLKTKRKKSLNTTAYNFFIRNHYGFSRAYFEICAFKNNLSVRIISSKTKKELDNFIESKANLFNRFLKLDKRKRIEEIKKESSWRGRRLRQGLPVHGQRTHSNASTSKKLNRSISLYEI